MVSTRTRQHSILNICTYFVRLDCSCTTVVMMGCGLALAHALQTYSSPVHFLGGFVIGTVPFKQMLHIAYLPCAPLRSVGAALPLRCTAARYGLTVTAAIL